MVEISSLDDPRIAEYRFLPQRTGALRSGERTIVESEVVARRLLQHEWSSEIVESALLAPDAAERLGNLLAKRGVPPERVFVAPKALMERIVGYHLHQGVFLCTRVPPQTEIAALPLPAVVLVGVSSSTNVGAIIRSAAAFGFASIVCDAASASPWLRRCIRVSMGAIFTMAWHHAHGTTEELFMQLRQRGARLVGAEVGAPLVYSAFAWSKHDAIVFGSEGQGLSPSLLKQLDAVVRIPISPAVESLNVAAAAAIILAEHAEWCGLVHERMP
ncbi:MAG: RNA methyltransferase [Candidatus Kapabacteria bacterium]|nr:RNA methyltransferase [Candidatus Kapabacteria bacterium]MCS7303038.1 RNA methyltransferase [Candidatus Kapabacteria bacterium]